MTQVCQHPVSTNSSKFHKLSNTVPGRLAWCKIPKVGTTFTGFLHLWYAEEWERLGKVARAYPKNLRKTVVFVREPYSRLVSGYLDKVLLFPSWWPNLGHKVMRLAGILPAKSRWYDKCSVYASFPQFVKYFIESERTNTSKMTTSGRCTVSAISADTISRI